MIGTHEIHCEACGFVAVCMAPGGSTRLDECPSCGGAATYRRISDGNAVMFEVALELARARAKFAPMHSPHEGHSVIREEFEELWKHVMENTGTTPAARDEAIQLAAMAARYVVDLCPRAEAVVR